MASDQKAPWPSLLEWAFCERKAVEMMKRAEAEMEENKRAEAPYPMCRTPEKCAGKGYCPNEIACND